MRLSKAAIPLGHAWSSPFARRQGPLANVNAIDLAVEVAGDTAGALVLRVTD